MIVVPGPIQTHLNTRATTLAEALKIVRRDGQIFGFTSHDVSVTISGVLYSAFPGLSVKDLSYAATAAVGNTELTTLNDGSVFSTSDSLNEIWIDAEYVIFRYNYEAVSDGIVVLSAGTLGEVLIKLGDVKIEFRDLRQYLQHGIGSPSSKGCRARLGDAMCTVDINALAVTFTVTHVNSNQSFRDSSRGEAADYFGRGLIDWLTGNNAGLSTRVVRTHAADGTLVLERTMFATVQVGDTATLKPGCRLRFIEDCKTKYNNAINFQGEPHRPVVDTLIKPVSVGV